VYRSDGVTDAAGRFTLTDRDGPKVRPGRYVVLVKRLVDRNGNAPKPDDPRLKDPLATWQNTLPELYGDKERTPYNNIDVKTGPNDLPAIDLKSKP